MARIAGINIPNEKRIEASLPYIYGVGLTLSKKILAETNVDPNKRTKDLTEAELNRLREYIEKTYKVEGELRKEVTLNINRLQEIGSYRGLRHKKALPVRGQRTKTNARTRKGPRKSSNIVAGKKPVTKK